MKYTDLMKKLQNENQGHIILMKSGIFFNAIGKDAVALNELVGLQVTCMRDGLCKVGFQVKSLEKYVAKLKETKKSFAIYMYDKNTEKEEIILKYTNESVTETRLCKGCDNCAKKSMSEEEIIERVKKFGAC